MCAVLCVGWPLGVNKQSRERKVDGNVEIYDLIIVVVDTDMYWTTWQRSKPRFVDAQVPRERVIGARYVGSSIVNSIDVPIYDCVGR